MNSELEPIRHDPNLIPLVPPSQTAIQISATPSPSEFRATAVNEALLIAYRAAGTLKLTPEETTKLTAPFARSVFECKMGKFTYIPHIHISRRLTEVFGPGQWTMIRRSEKMLGNQIMAEWVMIVRGVYIGESWGAQDYHPNNPNQSYADVLEATRGECIRRIAGKYLDCGGQAWDPEVQRQEDLARTRKILEKPAAEKQPISASSNIPQEEPLRAAKMRIWALCKPFRGNAKTWESAESELIKMSILKTGQTISNLDFDELHDVIDKIEIELRQRNEKL